MEPVSLVLAGGTLAVFYADYVLRREETASHRASLLPTLPEVLALPDDGQTTSSPVLVLAVNIQRVRLQQSFCNENFKMRVKYGEPGNSVFCDTMTEKADWPAASTFVAHLREDHPCEVEFGMTCLFLASERQYPYLRLRLLRGNGCCPQVLARAQFAIPSPGGETTRFELPLHLEPTCFDCARCFQCVTSERSTPLGILEVSIESRYVSKNQLRDYLRLLNAQKQKGAYVVGKTPVVEGCVDHDEPCTSESDTEILAKGTPLSPGLRSSLSTRADSLAATRSDLFPKRDVF